MRKTFFLLALLLNAILLSSSSETHLKGVDLLSFDLESDVLPIIRASSPAGKYQNNLLDASLFVPSFKQLTFKKFLFTVVLSSSSISILKLHASPELPRGPPALQKFV